MALSESEVRHVAMLARLALTDEQVETLAVELNSILGHIDTIQQLDLEGVEPTAHAIPWSTRRVPTSRVPACRASSRSSTLPRPRPARS